MKIDLQFQHPCTAQCAQKLLRVSVVGFFPIASNVLWKPKMACWFQKTTSQFWNLCRFSKSRVMYFAYLVFAKLSSHFFNWCVFLDTVVPVARGSTLWEVTSCRSFVLSSFTILEASSQRSVHSLLILMLLDAGGTRSCVVTYRPLSIWRRERRLKKQRMCFSVCSEGLQCRSQLVMCSLSLFVVLPISLPEFTAPFEGVRNLFRTELLASLVSLVAGRTTCMMSQLWTEQLSFTVS